MRILLHIFFQVDKIFNSIAGLGEEVKDDFVVRKIFRSLPSRFNPKVSTLEELTKLDKMIVDMTHGTLLVYEQRIEDKSRVKK